MRMRRSASLAISSARRRARSERPPQALAWRRQAMRRNRNCLWFERVSSPKASRYLSLSWPTVNVPEALDLFADAGLVLHGVNHQ